MKNRYLIMAAAVTVSALLQAFTMNVFLDPVQLLPSGFTGIAALLSRIAALAGISLSTSFGMVALNIPVALKGNASTAGMDFIALYVSNRMGKSIWQYVFAFNCCLLCVFGALFGWGHAGYSILFQFIATRTIDSFYHRFKRVTLQITTQKPDQVVKEYVGTCRRGISVVEGYGGYSGKKMSLMHTVVSTYEVHDILLRLKAIDPAVIVNVMPTESFVGSFYQKPLD